MKTFFQKLILSIPLRPKIAAFFAIIIGTLGLSLPSVYLFIRIQDSIAVITFLKISRLDLNSVIDFLTCTEYLTGIKLPSYWLSDSIWNTLFRGFPLIMGMQYFHKFDTKKSRNMLFAFVMLYLVSNLVFAILFVPEPIKCTPGWEVAIYDYSISWFSFFVPIVSLLLGIFAYQKQKTLVSLENPV
ncbi:MAG: hypothetical protein ACOYZ6_19305 [Chloroflexota bacterium]